MQGTGLYDPRGPFQPIFLTGIYLRLSILLGQASRSTEPAKSNSALGKQVLSPLASTEIINPEINLFSLHCPENRPSHKNTNPVIPITYSIPIITRLYYKIFNLYCFLSRRKQFRSHWKNSFKTSQATQGLIFPAEAFQTEIFCQWKSSSSQQGMERNSVKS